MRRFTTWMIAAGAATGLAAPVLAADMAPSRTMAGMYSYMADAAMFQVCETDERYAVAFEEDNIMLERAYLEVVEEPGGEMLVFIQARIEERPAMEGDGMEVHVIPEKFLSIDTERDCTTLAEATS